MTEHTEHEVLTNQTVFFDAELMEQVPPSLPVEEDPHKQEKIVASKKRQRQFILIGTISFVLVMLGIACVVLITPELLPIVTVTPSPIALKTTPEQVQLNQKLDDLEAEIRKADPIDIGFPYPPITSRLFLDN